MVMDGEVEDNVLRMKVGEGALRNVFLFRSPGLFFTLGKAELRGEKAPKRGLNSRRTWPAAVNLFRDSYVRYS